MPGFGHMRFSVLWLLMLYVGMGWVCTPQCGYITAGPVYRKDTILGYCARSFFWAKLYRPCTCKVAHTQLQGSLTTQAAEYPQGLCEAVAATAG